MTKIKEFFSAIAEWFKKVFRVIAENWKIFAGAVVIFLSALFGILGYKKISDFFGGGKIDDEAEKVIEDNDEEIAKTKKWIKESKQLHETNEQAIDRYNKFLANNVPNS